MFTSYDDFFKKSILPIEFLSSKEGFGFTHEESPSFLIRTGAAFFNIPVSTITAIGLGIISLLSLLPFAFFKLIDSENQKSVKNIIQKNDQTLLLALVIAVGSIANIFTLTFHRREIKENLKGFFCNIEIPLQTIGFLPDKRFFM